MAINQGRFLDEILTAVEDVFSWRGKLADQG